MEAVPDSVRQGGSHSHKPSESSRKQEFTVKRVMGYLAGGGVIALAVVTWITNLPPRAILQWLEQMFGVGFLVLFSSLIGVGLYAAVALWRGRDSRFWLEAGMQAAGGIATLALTFTLLGISLGIGTLADQEINPDTVQQIVQALTSQFSMAFMTTVVGLPASSALRALLSLIFIRCQQQWEFDANASGGTL